VRAGVYRLEAEIARALSHPVRLRILDILRGGEECVCHITATLGLRQAYVSQHLATLRAVGLVVVRREGLNIYYRLRDELVLHILDGLVKMAGLLAGQELKVPPAERPLSCPCPKCKTLRTPEGGEDPEKPQRLNQKKPGLSSL